jgi:bifunctional DNA-binding transcriptional regulator/antitoxin component of YhaV-PrlF toxin-antitoxin module
MNIPYYIGYLVRRKLTAMLIKITAKRQATFPARVLDTLGVKPGDRIELQEGPDGFMLRARRIDRSRLAPLRARLRKGKGAFDLEAFRSTPHDRALRD